MLQRCLQQLALTTNTTDSSIATSSKPCIAATYSCCSCAHPSQTWLLLQLQLAKAAAFNPGPHLCVSNVQPSGAIRYRAAWSGCSAAARAEGGRGSSAQPNSCSHSTCSPWPGSCTSCSVVCRWDSWLGERSGHRAATGAWEGQ